MTTKHTHEDWYFLILEAEEASARTGLGLGDFWGHVNRDDYEEALTSLDRDLTAERHYPEHTIYSHRRPIQVNRRRAWQQANLERVELDD